MRYNKKSPGTKTVNLAGGDAYKLDARTEFLFICLTSFLKDQFYRSANDTASRLISLLDKVEPEFAAKASLFARNEYGMRSITHLVGGEIAHRVKGMPWTKRYFKRLFHRPDDMLEVTSYYASKYKLHPLPNALKKAIREKLSSLPGYALSKYRGEGKSIKMIDLVNLTHPKNTEAIAALVKGTLRATETWETKLTQAGQIAETEEEKTELKASSWEILLTNKSLGYLALLRNLRNILTQAPNCVSSACKALESKEHIEKALIFPFQFVKALDAVKDKLGAKEIATSIAKAIELSLNNVPVFPGRTLICIDVSGSMSVHIHTAALFGAALYKKNDSDIILFNDYAKAFTLPDMCPTLMIAKEISKRVSGGTEWAAPLKSITKLKKKYDRIVYISDAQSWRETYYGQDSVPAVFEKYCSTVGTRPHLYSIDLAGYGTSQFPQDKVYLLAGLSQKIFDLMKFLEEDKTALIKKVESEVL